MHVKESARAGERVCERTQGARLCASAHRRIGACRVCMRGGTADRVPAPFGPTMATRESVSRPKLHFSYKILPGS
eukprot:1720843-Pleurochrysis_carterae.AAC.1